LVAKPPKVAQMHGYFVAASVVPAVAVCAKRRVRLVAKPQKVVQVHGNFVAVAAAVAVADVVPAVAVSALLVCAFGAHGHVV